MIKDDKRKFFTAGELANIFNVSKQSLLYYDKVHLLSPDFVSENGYRNYSIKQFLDLEIIVNLRALDISIANIKKYLADRSKDNFVRLLQEKTAECEANIKNNQVICDTISRITEDLHKKELIPTHHITLCWHNDRLMRLTALNEDDDGKSRISKFARHSQRRAHHKGALPNHAGWVLDQEAFFRNHDFTRSIAFFSCATNAGKHKQAIKVTLPAGLYLEMIFSGTFYENGNSLVKRITDFLEANKMTAVGDIYVLPLENHWFSCSCSQYVNKIFLRVVDQTPQEIY